MSHMPEIRQSPALARAADTIRRAVLGQAKIIDDLLDLSRARTGKLTLKLTASELNSSLTAIVQAAKANAARKDIAVEFICEPTRLVASCDPVRVEQILWNLLSNSIKFTPKGGNIVVRLARDNMFAKLSVTDSGEGIAPDDLVNVFDMFNQGQRSRAAQEAGMGIGLALVRELTQAQGGHVKAESGGIGRGSTFTVWLPLAEENADIYPRPTSSSSFKGMRILLVDDSVDSAEPFSKLLGLLGAHVATAASGVEALQQLAQQKFDLLISDVGMPEMSGYELISEVRAISALADLPAIALTGYGRNEDKEQALQAGFTAHLAKPASLEDIKATIAIISQSRSVDKK
jgi:two-component system CheB/CheR fusion protein